jgi:hypothetical protein
MLKSAKCYISHVLGYSATRNRRGVYEGVHCNTLSRHVWGGSGYGLDYPGIRTTEGKIRAIWNIQQPSLNSEVKFLKTNTAPTVNNNNNNSIDYQKVFGSFPHSWVNKSIELVGVNSKIFRFCKMFMEKWNTRLILKTKQELMQSQPIQIRREIFQGDSLSP